MTDSIASPVKPTLEGRKPSGRTVHIDAPPGGIVTGPVNALHGWLAVDASGPLEKLSLVNGRGTLLPLTLVERPDVRASRPDKVTTGFSGWIDIRAAADGPWAIRYTQGSETSDIACSLAADATHAEMFNAAKARKLSMVRSLLRCPRCRTELVDDGAVMRCPSDHTFACRDDAFDLLDDSTRASAGTIAGDYVSAHGYDPALLDLIAHSSGPIIDVGAGLRPLYRDDVINLEIVPYPTTDVIAASEHLPFADDTFDLVISVAVLEHVRDPFSAARELARIMRPGGRIFAAVPFLQPYHGYPNHFYNMTSAGLQNLFTGLDVEHMGVPQSGGPIFALTWILQAWRHALPPAIAADFDNMRVADLVVDPMLLVNMPFVRELPPVTNMQLASLNVLIGRKPLY